MINEDADELGTSVELVADRRGNGLRWAPGTSAPLCAQYWRDETVVERQRLGEQTRYAVDWRATCVVSALPNTNIDPPKTGRTSTSQVTRKPLVV